MRTAVWTGALAVSLLSMPVRPVAAQDPPFERIQMYTIVVKPGMTSTFEAQVKVLNEARAKAKDPVGRSFWQASRGGPARTFYSVTRFNKWAELESLTMNTDVPRRRRRAPSRPSARSGGLAVAVSGWGGS